MAASVQFRPQNRDLGMVMKEVEEDLAIFLGMRNSEKDRTDHLLGLESAEFIDINESDSLLIPKASELETVLPATDDNFLNLEIERSDYNWLLSQADVSLLPSEVISTQVSTMNHYDISNVDDTPLKSEVDSKVEESASQSDCSVQLPASTGREDSSSSGKKMSSSLVDRKPIRRAVTPTAQSTSREKPKPSRSSTPTPRTVLPSAKPIAAQARSSTPGRGASQSSTPASRPSLLPSSNSAARSATPTHAPLTTSTFSSNQTVLGRKTATTMSKKPVSSHGTSPTVKPRPSKPTEMLSVSHDGSQNLKPSMIKRPVSASRGRPVAPSTLSALTNAKPRQKSCSPAKVRAPTTTAQKTGPKILSRSRGHSSEGDDVNPVLMGTKMVNRVVNMRKLAPPKQDEYISHDSQRKASHENSGFGRSLSKSSLDMAIRHMDIGRSIGDTLHPVATGAFSSARGIRSGSSKSGGISVLESPPSSSCGSSKSSGCINSHFLNGTEFDY